MTTVFLRLVLIYFITVSSIRLMGKRQIGELQMSELVTAFFLSELASYPVTNQNIPITYGIVPVITLICTEVILSYLSMKVPWIKRLFDASPNILIRKGKIDVRELSRTRLTLDELFSQLRLKDVSDLGEISYALLEPNGQLSVIRRAAASPPVREEMQIPAPEKGMQHLVVADGVENPHALQGAELSKKDLARILRTHKLDKKDVLLLAVNDAGEVTYIKKEKR